MKVVAIIPARGGSKAIPHKNIARLNGKPLLAYTIEAARQSKCINRCVLSTDDPRVASVGRRYGAELPFLRPKSLAGDRTPMADVIEYTLNRLNKDEGFQPDVLILLQPTSPLRTARSIDRAFEKFRSSKADTLVSVVEVPHQYSPVSVMRREKSGRLVPYQKGKMILRRQDKPRLYARNGPAILIMKVSVLKKGSLYGRHVVGYPMSASESVDVDGPEDLFLASFLLKKKKRLG